MNWFASHRCSGCPKVFVSGADPADARAGFVLEAPSDIIDHGGLANARRADEQNRTLSRQTGKHGFDFAIAERDRLPAPGSFDDVFAFLKNSVVFHASQLRCGLWSAA